MKRYLTNIIMFISVYCVSSKLSQLERQLRRCVMWNVTGSSPDLPSYFLSVPIIILYCMSLLYYYFIIYPYRSIAYGNGKNKEKYWSLFKRKKSTILLRHIYYGKTIVFSKCVLHRIVVRFQEKLHLLDE